VSAVRIAGYFGGCQRRGDDGEGLEDRGTRLRLLYGAASGEKGGKEEAGPSELGMTAKGREARGGPAIAARWMSR
jgi:hypothetical protein